MNFTGTTGTPTGTMALTTGTDTTESADILWNSMMTTMTTFTAVTVTIK